MVAEFRLEIFFERSQDREFAEREAEKLCSLVDKLNPNVKPNITVRMANKGRIVREDLIENGKHYSIPYHHAISEGCQTLLITNEEIGPKREGRHWGELGCVSKSKLEQKGTKSAYITVHEWLHTLAAAGKQIDGNKVRDPDDNRGYAEFQRPDPCGEWHGWYEFILSGRCR